MDFDPSTAVLEFDPSSAKEETPAFDLASATIEEQPSVSARAQALPPGESVPTVSGQTQPLPQMAPAREQAIADLQRPKAIAQTPEPSLEQQKAMLTGVAQPESEIQPIGKEGSVLRGVSSVAAGVLNRPEYLVALANPATATAVAARFAPEIAKQFFEDLGKATQGDDEALGRAAAIGIPALIGGIKAGRTITERMNSQVALETAQKASSSSHIDALARLESAPKSEPTLLPLSKAAVESTERTTDARKIQPTAEIHGDVRPQPENGVGQVPVDESGAGVLPQTQGGIPQETVTPAKEVIPSETQTQEKGQEILASPDQPAAEGGAGTAATPTEPTPASQVETPGFVERWPGKRWASPVFKSKEEAVAWRNENLDNPEQQSRLSSIQDEEGQSWRVISASGVEPPANYHLAKRGQSASLPVAAETITGGGKPIQEGKASEMPAEPRRKSGRQPERPPDLIDYIAANVGKLRGKKSSKPGEEGYYTDTYKESIKHGPVRSLYSNAPGAQSLDSAVDILRREGIVGKDFTVDDLHDELIANALARKGHREQQTSEQRIIQKEQSQREDFERSAIDNQKPAEFSKGAKPISVSELFEGDEFELSGAKVKVKKLHFDEETGDLAYVELEDGKRFGVQTVSGDQVIYPDAGTLNQITPSTEFAPEEPKATTPKLRPGEKGTAEMFQGSDQPFNLAGETATDFERVAREKAAAEKLKAEADALQAKQQPGLIGMGGATPEEFTKPGTVVSNMFAAIDRDRAELGKPPMEPGTPRTWDQDQQTAMARMNRDPEWIPNLIKEVLDKPRPLRSDEHAGMVLQKAFWKAEANNALRRISQAFEDGREEDLVQAKADAARFEDNLDQMEEAVGRGGTGSEAGRSLQAQKMGLTDDLTLVEMRMEMRGKIGGRKLTEREASEVERIHKEYEQKLADLSKSNIESERRRVEAETRATLAELGRQSAETKVPPPHIQRVIDRIRTTIKTGADAARERLKGKLFTIGDPEVILDLARIGADNIWTIGEDFARWSLKMVEDIGERVRPHLNQIWEASKKLIDEVTDIESGAKKSPAGKATATTVRETIKKGDTPEQKIAKLTDRIKDRATNGKKQPITPAIQALARSLIEQGVRGRDELVKAVHEIIAPILPDWDLYKTKQAISGYGDFRTISKDEVSVILRDYKGQLQQMLKLEDMAFKKAPLRSGVEQREVTKAQQDLIKLVNEAKRKGGYETTDPETQLRTALDEAKKRTQTLIDEYERKIAEKDYSVRKLDPIKPDADLINKQAELKRVRKKWEQAKREAEYANRKAWQKALDKFVRWERAFKLSSPVVFGKLAAAALTRVATTAAEEVVGAGLGVLPGIRTVARQAPREGGINVRAMAKSLASAVTKGMADAAQTARKGAADIDVVYGEKLVDKDWANFFGQLHGMMKAPIKRAEFELSLAKRIEFNKRLGVDVTDKLVMTRLITEALNDGYRSIFMQRGFSSDMFNTLVGIIEKSKKYPMAGEISARTLRFLLPVVRVPANIVAEAATGIYGAPLASARTMTAAVRGTLGTLDPVIADLIMRQWKKGSIGLGLMAIGYFNPQIFGGLDWREKRQPGATKVAGIQIGGVDIPRWATHAPWFELMQLGATIRHVKDQHVSKTGETKGISEGLWAAGLGLIEETPFVNEMLHADKLFDPAKRSQFLGEMARGTLIPQIFQQAAAMTDSGSQRKPRNVVEHLEMGIPGLRQNVPLKPAPKSGVLVP